MLRKYNIRFTPIRKITTGFVTAAAAMIWAGVIQVYIYKLSPCGDQANSCMDDDGNVLAAPINVWAQTGVYVLIALSEIFASITSLEYAYSKAPRNMRSLVQAVALFMSAISSAIGEAMVPLTEDPLLQWNYFVAAILAGVGGFIFHMSFRNLDAEEDALNLLPAGNMEAEVKGPHEEEDPRPVAGEITEKN
jgi:POT family proton-dependent oligopeptide transporter